MAEDELPGQESLPGVGEHVCSKCARTFEHTGRGRPPKTCPDCRTPRGKSAKPSAEEAPKRPRAIETLKQNIAQQLVMLGLGVAVFDAFDAEVIVKNADRGATALANLAATNPKIRALLESVVEGAGYLPVAMWAVSTALPILAHHGILRGVPDPARSGPPSPGAGPAPQFIDLSKLQDVMGVRNGKV